MNKDKFAFLCADTKKLNRGAMIENLGLVITVVGLVIHIAGSYYHNGAVDVRCVLGNDNAKKKFMNYHDSLKE